MSHLIGRGRYARSVYPVQPLGVAPFSVASAFVWRQNGPNNRNVFGDFPGLYEATSTLDPASIKWVAIDSTAAPCAIPSGPWSLNNFKFYNSAPAGTTASETILVETGAVLSFLELEIHNGVTLQSAATSPPVVVASGQASSLRVYNGHVQSVPGAAPFFHAESGSDVGIHVFENASINGTTPFFQVDAGVSQAAIILNDNAILDANNLSGTGPILVEASASASASLTQPALTGLLTLTYVSQAGQITYPPGNPANWVGPAPTTVQQALDRIAANTTNAHPIP